MDGSHLVERPDGAPRGVGHGVQRLVPSFANLGQKSTAVSYPVTV